MILLFYHVTLSGLGSIGRFAKLLYLERIISQCYPVADLDVFNQRRDIYCRKYVFLQVITAATWRCLTALCCIEISSINFNCNRDVHSHYTRQASNLHVPISTSSSQQRTFYHRSIQDFNALPTTLKQPSSFGKFKSSLKTHLLTT